MLLHILLIYLAVETLATGSAAVAYGVNLQSAPSEWHQCTGPMLDSSIAPVCVSATPIDAQLDDDRDAREPTNEKEKE